MPHHNNPRPRHNRQAAHHRTAKARAKQKKQARLKVTDRWTDRLDLRLMLGLIGPKSAHRRRINRVANIITPEQLCELLGLLKEYGPVLLIDNMSLSLLKVLSKDQYRLRLGRESAIMRFIRLDSEDWSRMKPLTKYEAIKEQLEDYYDSGDERNNNE